MSAQLGTVDDNGFVWTQQRQNFVKLYVATGDAKAAARDAKLPKKDDPEELLKHESVIAKIDELHAQVLRRIHETADTVIARYSNWAESNILDYIDLGRPGPDGNVVLGNVMPKDWRTFPRHMQQRIKKFKITRQGDNTNFEVEMHDAVRANDRLAAILKLEGDDATDNPRDFAEAMYEFVKEVATLDEHYDDPDQQ